MTEISSLLMEYIKIMQINVKVYHQKQKETLELMPLDVIVINLLSILLLHFFSILSVSLAEHSRLHQYQAEERRLFAHLFDKYDSLSRPVRNASSTVVVDFGLSLNQILDLVSHNFSNFNVRFLSNLHVFEDFEIVESVQVNSNFLSNFSNQWAEIRNAQNVIISFSIYKNDYHDFRNGMSILV